MIKLRNRWQGIPGSFQYLQPETGQHFASDNFAGLVQQVIDHRALNPRFKLATDPNLVANELDSVNALRLSHIKGADLYLATDTSPQPEFDPKSQAPRRAPASVAGGVKRIVTGAQILRDWLGSGGQPVDPKLAGERAAVCATCPQNDKGDWTRFFTVPASEEILAHIDLRNQLQMGTPYDAQIHVCMACLCPLKLKVHVPLEHIAARMTAEDRAKLDPRCWILKEPNAPTT